MTLSLGNLVRESRDGTARYKSAMGYITLINNPLKNAIDPIVTTFDLSQFRCSDDCAARTFGWYVELCGISSIVIDNVIEAVLTIRKFISTANSSFSDN